MVSWQRSIIDWSCFPLKVNFLSLAAYSSLPLFTQSSDGEYSTRLLCHQALLIYSYHCTVLLHHWYLQKEYPAALVLFTASSGTGRVSRQLSSWSIVIICFVVNMNWSNGTVPWSADIMNLKNFSSHLYIIIMIIHMTLLQLSQCVNKMLNVLLLIFLCFIRFMLKKIFWACLGYS